MALKKYREVDSDHANGDKSRRWEANESNSGSSYNATCFRTLPSDVCVGSPTVLEGQEFIWTEEGDDKQG